MNFNDLLHSLPDCPGSQNLSLKGSRAFDYVVGGPQGFVPPDLAHFEGIENDHNPSVLLISAAGAVGKSTIAAVLSAHKNAPLWDLASEGPVATHSLSGRLTDSFGFEGLGALYSALSSGQTFIVIDALDEARVKTTEESFFVFLRDIAKLAGTSSSAPRFILLGRTQVTEAAWLAMKEEGVACGVYTIEPFDEENAARFVDERVRVARDKRGAEKMIQHRDPYIAARDTILGRLKEALANEREDVDEREIRAFLGYAPVLDAVATLLAGTTNFAQLRETFGRESTGADNREKAVRILEDIVRTILLREQSEKFVRNALPVLTSAAISRGLTVDQGMLAAELYTPVEQSERLVALVLGSRNRPSANAAGALVDVYEDQVASFLPEHPFLRDNKPANSVFESVLFARALVRGTSGIRSAAERFLESDDYKPSSLLASFYLAELGRDGGELVLPPEHVGILYDSLRAGETDTRRIRLSLDAGDPSDELRDEEIVAAEVEFEILPHGEVAARSIRTGLVTEVRKASTLRFAKATSNVHITVPCAVSLGSGGREVLLGPAVHVDCDELWIVGERLTISSAKNGETTENSEDTGVTLHARSYIGAVARRPVVSGHLEVSWPGAEAFPFSDFAVPEPARTLQGPVREAYFRFRRIGSTFRSHKKGALARYRGKLEHQRVLKGAVGAALLDQMRREGLLTLVDNFYYWNSARAAELVGVTWVDLRRGILNDRLAEYLKGFVDENRGLFNK